jgi:hypothetical protein
MRNRGIELYVDDIDLSSIDSDIILKNIFTKHQQEDEILKSNFLIHFLRDFRKILSTSFKFEDTLHLCKLIKDYWLVDKNNSFVESLLNALKEMYPEISKEIILNLIHGILSKNNEITNYTALNDIFKLIKFPIYKFLSNFSSYSKFNEILTANNPNSLIDLSKQTAYIQLWLQQIPLKHIDLIGLHFFENDFKMTI